MTPLDGALVGLLFFQSLGTYWLLTKGAEERRRLVNVIIARNPHEFAVLQRDGKPVDRTPKPVPPAPIGL